MSITQLTADLNYTPANRQQSPDDRATQPLHRKHLLLLRPVLQQSVRGKSFHQPRIRVSNADRMTLLE